MAGWRGWRLVSWVAVFEIASAFRMVYFQRPYRSSWVLIVLSFFFSFFFVVDSTEI